MKVGAAGSAEECLFLPDTAGTAPLPQETADKKKQEQPPQTPYQSQERPQQRIHPGPFGGLVKPCRHQEPPHCEQQAEYCSDSKQGAFHRQSRLGDAVGIVPAPPITEVLPTESVNLVCLLYGRSDLGDLRLK